MMEYYVSAEMNGVFRSGFRFLRSGKEEEIPLFRMSCGSASRKIVLCTVSFKNMFLKQKIDILL